MIDLTAIAAAEKHFESLQRRYTTTHNGKHCELVHTALACLRECAERREGCEYCLQGEDLAYGQDSVQRTGRIYLDGNLLTADLYTDSMAVAVCFCPVCGRKLK